MRDLAKDSMNVIRNIENWRNEPGRTSREKCIGAEVSRAVNENAELSDEQCLMMNQTMSAWTVDNPNPSNSEEKVFTLVVATFANSCRL